MGFWDTIKSGIDTIGDVFSGRPADTPSASKVIGQAGVSKEELIKQQQEARARQQTAFLEAQKRISARPLPQVGDVRGPQAAQLGQVAGPTAATFDRTAAPQAASLGQAGQDVRGMQLAGLEQLQQRASGTVPTIAEQQLQRGLEQQLAAQAAQANVGGSPLAQRQAQMQGAQAMQQTAGQSALAAQQERMQAEQALLAASQGVRGQDLSRAQAEAGFQQQANLAGADLASREALAQAQLQQQAGLAGYQGALQQTAQQAQLEQQAGLAGYQGQLQQAQMNAQLQAQQQQQLNALESQFLAQGYGADQAQQQALLTLRAQNLGVARGAAQQQATAAQAARTGATQAWGGVLSGLSQGIPGMGDMFSGIGGGGGAGGAGALAGGGGLAGINAGAGLAGGASAMPAAGTVTAGSGIAAGAGGAAAAAPLILTSDVKAKSNVKDSKSIEEFLSKMKAKDFDYKEGYGDKKQTGILAQDLLKSKVGKNIVTDYNQNAKGIDVVKSIGPVLASLSHLNEKINKLEKAKKSA